MLKSKVPCQAALRSLTYKKGYPGKGLLQKRHGHLKIEVLSIAAHADGNGKSISWYCTFVGGNLIT